MTRLRTLVVAAIAILVLETHGFSVQFLNICRYGSFCNYIKDGVQRTLYGLFNFDKKESDYCLQERIHECTCYEMLILQKRWIPDWPDLDEVDVQKLMKQSAKVYHSDHLDKDYKEDKSAPFIFLTDCVDIFKCSPFRKEYRKYLDMALGGLPTDQSMEPAARFSIYNINTNFIKEHPDMKTCPNAAPNGKGTRTTGANTETLHIFLDNTNTMVGDRLNRGKGRLKGLQNRIFNTQTNIHLIPGRKIINKDEVTLSKDNIQQLVYNKWDGKGNSGSGHFLWEYVWEQMQNEKNTDCEIIVITDGYNTFRTGGSARSFQGIGGLSVLMENLKTKGEQLCRTFIYCVTDDCKNEVGKSFKDLTIPTGGFACDTTNFEDCDQILTSSHADRVGFSAEFKKEHLREVKGNPDKKS